MAEERVQRRLTAILAADVVGYSRLMGADEASTHARFNAHFSELIEPTIESCQGRRRTSRHHQGSAITFSWYSAASPMQSN